MSADREREDVLMRELLLATMESPSPGFADRVLAGLDRREERREPRGHWALSLVAAGLTVALVATLAIGMRLTRQASTPAGQGAVSPAIAIHGSGARLFPGGWLAEQAGRRTTLFLTGDGGRTWATRLAYDGGLPSQVVVDGTGAGVVVAGPSGEAATGLVLYQTRDGGITWQRLAPVAAGGSAWGVPYFLDARQGWVLVSLGPGRAEMLSTADGGQTWSASPEFNDRANFPGLSSVRLRILWASGGRAIVVPPLGAGTMPVHVFVTEDGGASWRSSFPVVPDEQVSAAGALLDARLLPDGRAVLFLQRVDGDGGRSGGLLAFVSADAGRSWSRPAALDGPAPTSDRAMFALDEAHWWASSGSGGELLTTDDGGRTVHPLGAVLPAGYAFRSIGFTSGSDGWAVAASGGRTAVFVTHDGGAHWQPLPPPG
ncbi:MAG TPA: exo-alpha-sialidase [Candidatus Dormibacteraeota bacterium]|nr:exo-alpha-sialidase [Candidatus Dormibacteraeota bacterium]